MPYKYLMYPKVVCFLFRFTYEFLFLDHEIILRFIKIVVIEQTETKSYYRINLILNNLIIKYKIALSFFINLSFEV